MAWVRPREPAEVRPTAAGPWMRRKAGGSLPSGTGRAAGGRAFATSGPPCREKETPMDQTPAVVQQVSDAEWANHVNVNPGHQRKDTATPAGWICEGVNGEACPAQSSSLSGA